MAILGNFINAVAVVTNMALTLYMYIIIARAVLSWVNPDPYNPIVQFIHSITEPSLKEVRSRIPAVNGIDLSPIIVIFGIIFLKVFIVGYLSKIAGTMM